MSAQETTVRRQPLARRRSAPVAVVLLAITAVAVGLIFGKGAGAATEMSSVVDAGDLRALSASLERPIYWTGTPAPGSELELTQSGEGSVYVRYLTAGAEAGDSRRTFTTVATYPVPSAFAVLSREARRATAIVRDLPNGGLALMDTRKPQSVYLAWPDSGYEVELFDPSPRRAMDLVLGGAVAPVR